MVLKRVVLDLLLGALIVWMPGVGAPSLIDGAKKEGTVVLRLAEGVKLYSVRPEMAKDYEEVSKLYYSIVK